MVNPTINELLDVIDDRYKLVIVTSKRARQLSNGDKPLTDKEEPNSVTLAAREIAEGKVSIINDDLED
ncbi:MAG: DNA-directed RNA polymerase subunit omega [Clostridia bacterium]|nr:DNA-directed RNA polymerase subunit omega [Clostridia bacterium]